MTVHNYTNKASTASLGANMDTSTTTLTVSAPSYSGWPAAPFWGIVARGTASAELVEVTAVAGTSLTVVRGQGGTSAASHTSGDVFEHVAPAAVFASSESHIEASTSVHGVSGSVVGTTGGQSIQDKTYRGAHTSTYTDSLPAGVTSSYLNTADNTNARDGFVHKNTGGNATQRAFLAEQAGTPRFEVFGDGKLKLNPSGTPGLENDGTTQLDGATTVNNTLTVTGATTAAGIAASGNVTVGGTLGVTGATTAAGITGTTITASGALSGNSVASTTSVTGASATLTGALNANSVAATAGVTGASATLTGAVTAASVAATGAVTAASMAATNEVTAHGGRAVVAVSNLASITSPISGQVAWHTGNRSFYQYDGTAWVPLGTLAGRIITTAGDVHSNISTTETDVPKLAIEGVRIKSGTFYTFNVNIYASGPDAHADFWIRVRKDTALTGTILTYWTFWPQANNLDYAQSFSFPWRATADDDDGDFYVSIQRVAGTGSIDLQGDRKTAFWIDDKGADTTSVWQEVA